MGAAALRRHARRRCRCCGPAGVWVPTLPRRNLHAAAAAGAGAAATPTLRILLGGACPSGPTRLLPLALLQVRTCAALRWAPHDRPLLSPEGSVVAVAESFGEHFFEDDNVLSLYAIQRNLLCPSVDEQAQAMDGLQHVEIIWRLDGQPRRGCGAARSKKAARREAARRLLRTVPVTEEVASQMRKQMVNSLRMRLGAEIVADLPVESCVRGEVAYRVAWRVPQPSGRLPIELEAIGSGISLSEAQARAFEGLYCQALGRRLIAGSVAVAREQSERSAQAVVAAAEACRHVQLGEGLSALSSEAAGELAARHNATIQRFRIQAEDDVVQYRAGFRCTLSWRWFDANAAPLSESTTGIGATKRAARGEAMRAMLIKQGHMDDITPETLNQAARVRSLAKADDDATVPAALSFLQAQPSEAWSLVLTDVWQLALARGSTAAIAELGDAMRQCFQIRSDSCDKNGIQPHLWEQLLDACAHVAHGELARLGLAALDRLPVSCAAFPSMAFRDYFVHFRRLLAWERVGQNQAAIYEIQELGSSAKGTLLEKELCVLPYLTLRVQQDGWMDPFLAEARGGDVAFLQRRADDGGIIGSGHLAVVTSVTTPAGSATRRRSRLTVRCSTLSVQDLESRFFEIHGLDTEVSALRMATALRALARPMVPREEPSSGHVSSFLPELRTVLVESFHVEGRGAASAAADRLPFASVDVGSNDLYFSLAQDAASSRGTPMTKAQAAAVRRSLDHRVTLIHGPPGTGKTTAAVCIVIAWRPCRERILCVADSNVAADHLHASLSQWGISALRFSLSEVDSESQGLEGFAQGLGSHRRRVRSAVGHAGSAAGLDPAYQQIVAMRSAVAEYQIVVTTCISAGHKLLDGIVFPRVLVDECTQSVEPSSLVPLSHGCDRLVLIGDHRQLPPTVITERARQGGLERSLFARLADGCNPGETSFDAVTEPVLLDEQRRMHPSIAAFPNMHFYAGLVRDAELVRKSVLGIPWPRGGDVRVLLVNVGEVGREEKAGTSWGNDSEVQAVMGLLACVLHGDGDRAIGTGATYRFDCMEGSRLPPEEVAVITPYLHQKRLLQRELMRRSVGAVPDSGAASLLSRVRVATVDGFQGAECDLVVFSAVRSNDSGRLGFLRDERRANVLLTRARRGLVVFADVATMRRASGSVWSKWLAWVESKGAVIPLHELREHLSGLAPLAALGDRDCTHTGDADTIDRA